MAVTTNKLVLGGLARKLVIDGLLTEEVAQGAERNGDARVHEAGATVS